jgi:hypothetical protein
LFAELENSDTQAVKIHSLGASDFGLLGQGSVKDNKSIKFKPLNYNDTTKFTNLSVVNDTAMAID